MRTATIVEFELNEHKRGYSFRLPNFQLLRDHLSKVAAEPDITHINVIASAGNYQIECRNHSSKAIAATAKQINQTISDIYHDNFGEGCYSGEGEIANAFFKSSIMNL